MTRIAAVITALDAGEAERQARTALSRGADLAEIRLDHLANPSVGAVRRLAAAVGSRSIATLRSRAQGGGPGSADTRRDSLLREMSAARFAYLDIELRADGGRATDLTRRAKRHRGIVIVSHHFDRPTDAATIEDTLEACAAVGDVAKVAVPVGDVDAAIQIVDLQRRSGRNHPTTLIGTGIEGTITRVLAEDSGQETQYVALGGAALLGQLPLAVARRLRGRKPTVLGLVGHPLGHSLSPAIHEASLDALRLPAVYLPFDVTAESLDALLLAADRLRVRGFNVTIPYKEAIAPKLDELDGDAERLGAVNTVVVSDGWTKGYNTDVFGFRVSLRSFGLRVGDRTALVLGAGGAAKAVVDVLLREGATVQVANRSMVHAESLAEGFNETVEVLPIDSLPRRGPWDLLVNATPVGTKGFPPGPPVPDAVVAKAGFVYDLGYNPSATPLLGAAKRLGKPGSSGLEMLLHQAAKSFELWTGRPAAVDAMRRAAKEALG